MSSVDDLIAKLKELTKPMPKYKIGQEIWVIRKDEAIIATIWAESNGIYQIGHDYGYAFLEEKFIYPTKESVIEAEIKYWQSLREKVTCKHESEGYKVHEFAFVY